MVVKLKSLKADLDRESTGEWHPHAFRDADGKEEAVRFHVRAITYPPYQAARSEALRVAMRKADDGVKYTEEESAAIHGRLLAKHILLGWENFDETYSEDRAEEVLTDPAMRFLVGIVETLAMRTARIEVEFDKAAAKN